MDGPEFNGADYVPARDKPRLTRQMNRIFALMRDGAWRTLEDINQATGDPPASISAQLRHLRKRRFGGWVIEVAHMGGGLYRYRMTGEQTLFPNTLDRATRAELMKEVVRLQDFALRLAERIYKCHEILGRSAESKVKRVMQ